jgi:hypothetical protein
VALYLVCVAADGDGLPLVRGARRIGLEQPGRAAVVDAADEQRRAERPCAARLRELLNVAGDLLRQRLDVGRFAVAKPLHLRLSACDVDELTGVGDVARAGDADVVVGLMNLLDALRDLERRAESPAGHEDDAVLESDADGR